MNFLKTLKNRLLIVLCIFGIFNSFVFAEEGLKSMEDEKKDRNLYTIPIIFGSSDVGLGYGAQLIYIDRRTDGAIDGELQGILTTKDQSTLTLNVQREYSEKNYILEFSLSAVDWKSSFYGIGNNSPEENEELYVSKELGTEIGFKKPIFKNSYFGSKYIYKDIKTVDVEKGKLLDTGDYNENGKSSGVGFNYTLDKRDDKRNVKNGYIVRLESDFFMKGLGSDYDFSTYSFDARKFKSLSNNKMLAGQLYYSQSNGDVPLDYNSSLGSSQLLRGYLSKRYIDKGKLGLQGEYRFPIKGKFTGVIFAATGEVMDKNIELDELKSTAGLGFKYVLSEADGVKIRFDFGFNEDGTSAFYMDFGDAF